MPLSPFIAVSMSVVLPDWPGFVIVMEFGFAATEKSGPGFTVICVVAELLR